MIPRNEETNSEKFMYNSLLSVCGIIPRRQYDTILAEERWFLHKNLVWFHVIGRKQHNGYQLHQAFYFSRGAALGDPQPGQARCDFDFAKSWRAAGQADDDAV